MNVQKNFFTWSELTTTDTGLLNNPITSLHLANLACLWDYLNLLRKELGQPIFINSAFRTPAVNEQVGGSKCSYHKRGKAADIRTYPSSMARLSSYLKRDYELGYLTEYIVYPTFIHFAL